MTARAWWLIPLTVVLLGSVSGCGGSKLVPVEGIVTLDGKPVEGATVVFLPDGASGRPAQGLTASDGRFHLSTVSEKGAGPGDYKVVVTKTVGILPPGAEPPSPDDERKMLKQREDFAKHSEKYLRSLLPTIYTSPATTPLHCKVPPEQPVVLNLTTSASAPSASKSAR
jgi:hypothetical protein